ncbi:zinc ribbon domain-containing protein [Acidithiobacillus sp.]|uniref:zinc ribbon domain-containing protein n=1 Tax=Acidithiobacillus sp. TaxID=1872118 RepID=UPI00345A3767
MTRGINEKMKALSTFAKYIATHMHDERNRCQSCGMPMRFDKNKLTSSIYCSYCHDGTSFVEQDITLQDMKRKIRKVLSKRKVNSLVKLYLIARLSTLKRWRSA